MATPTTLQSALDQQPLGFEQPFVVNGVASGSTNAAVAASGGLSTHILANAIGTTLPGTRVGLPLPPGFFSVGRDWRLGMLRSEGTRTTSYALGNFIKVGTLNLAATGQQFTHDAATAPFSKVQMGQSQPIAGFMYIDWQVAGSVTAPIITSVKYVNQEGVTVTGVTTWTAPAIAVVAGSGFFLPLEPGDSGARDIVEITVGTAGSTGSANVYIVEHIDFVGQQTTNIEALMDGVFGGFTPSLCNPPVAASGTAVVRLWPYAIGTTATNTAIMNGTLIAST